jgi:hypothetical protein
MIKWLAGKLWFYKVEGMPCFNGLNIYRKQDPHSGGFVVKLGAFHFKCRHSKITKKWIVKAYLQKETYEQYSI